MMFIFFRGLLQKPDHKDRVRKSQAKAAIKATKFPPLAQPHYKTLLDKKPELKEFVEKNPKFKALLEHPLEDIVVVCVCVYVFVSVCADVSMLLYSPSDLCGCLICVF